MRSPLDPDRISRALRESSVTRVDVRERVGSTNAEAGRMGEPWVLVLAEHQDAGRGRLGRVWEEVPRAGLAMSVLLPDPPVDVGWVPLLAGVALRQAVEQVTGLACALKWPNDLLAPSGAKLAGILCEKAADGIVVGAGLNVDHTRAELPVPTAGSIALELDRPVGSIDRCALAAAYAVALDRSLADLAGGEPGVGRVRTAYRSACSTIGAAVDIQRGPDSPPQRVHAEAVADDGALVVRAADGTLGRLAAGDVRHVRVAE